MSVCVGGCVRAWVGGCVSECAWVGGISTIGVLIQDYIDVT